MGLSPDSAPKTFEEITEEIERLRDLIQRNNRGDLMPEGFSYRGTVWALAHLRNKKRSLSKRKK